MKKLLLVLLFLIPCMAFASTREIDMWSDFDKLIQPEAKQEIWQDAMYARYEANEKSLTDKIIYKIWKKTWAIKWPWSLATEKMRQKVRDCKKNTQLTASGCGWYDYKIIRLSPSGNYIELNGNWWESSIWRMLDTKTGKLVLSNDNGIIKSMWTADKKQFIWKTDTCEIGGCSDPKGTFITELGKFPKYKKVQ